MIQKDRSIRLGKWAGINSVRDQGPSHSRITLQGQFSEETTIAAAKHRTPRLALLQAEMDVDRVMATATDSGETTTTNADATSQDSPSPLHSSWAPWLVLSRCIRLAQLRLGHHRVSKPGLCVFIMGNGPCLPPRPHCGEFPKHRKRRRS